LQDVLDVSQKRFAVFSGLVGFSAGEEGFNANIGAMEKGDEVNQLGFFGGFAALGDGNVDFSDVLGFAKVQEGFGSVGSFEDGRAFPDPEAVDSRGACERWEEKRGKKE